MSEPAAPNKLTFAKAGLGLLFIIPIVSFILLALEVRQPTTDAADIQILESIHSHANPTFDFVTIHGTNLGGPAAIIIFTALIATALYFTHRHRAMAILLLGVGGAVLINTFLKYLFQRARPSLWTTLVTENSFSFPSGHAMVSSALALSIILIVWKTKWHWYALILGAAYILFIGFTRLYLGVHFPTDILAGWAVSLVWIMTLRGILTRRQRRAAAKEVSG